MDTRSTLIHEATLLLRSRGYSGFSYADLAKRVGIRKASIHHHFPSKEDLGVALVESYSEEFLRALADIWARGGDAPSMITEYFDLYRESLRQGLACLCGMLASEVEIAPAPVAKGVAQFMRANRQWLSRVISRGIDQGQIAGHWQADDAAEVLLNVSQGALLVARASDESSGFDRAVQAQLRCLVAT